MTVQRAVAVMAKRPAAGRTKTRLTPQLSPQQAADVYECFLRDTIDRLHRRTDCQAVIAIDSAESADYFHSIAPDIPQVVQSGETLGHRLDTVLTELLGSYDQAFAINSDSPDLPDAHFAEAFAELTKPESDIVLGPTDDGGYWLIGWKQRWSTVVTEVQMSTPQVLADTLARAADSGANAVLGPSWHDVDDAADLERFIANIDPAKTPYSAALLAPPNSAALLAPPE